VEARPQDAVVWTDANGRFAFGYVPPGRYQVRAQKTGYQLAALGAETPYRPPAIITLDAGGNRSGIAIRLQPFGAISGVVLDEEGDPVAGVQVSALTPGFQRRRRTLLPRSGAMTDSRGRYRLNTLASGRYVVAVRPFSRHSGQSRNPRQARARRHTRMASSITPEWIAAPPLP
jgi:protocatechuate 3,4-dioxygenase beta subunit